MTTQEMLDVVQSLYAAHERGDLAALAGLVAPDVRITQDPALPWGGTYRGRDGMATFLGRLTGTIASTLTTERLYAAGDHVVQVGRTRGHVLASGATFDLPETHVWTLDDGVVQQASFMIDSERMLEVLAS